MARPFLEEPKGSVANYPYFERGKDSTMAYLYRLFQERVVMFDGAMGTMIQKYKLGEAEYRGERFKVGLVSHVCFLMFDRYSPLRNDITIRVGFPSPARIALKLILRK